MSKDYTIFINKRPVKVDFKTLICHCTGEFKRFATKDEYSIFLRDYKLKTETLFPFITTVVSYVTNEEYPDVSKTRLQDSNLKNILYDSILLATWYGVYFNTDKSTRRIISLSKLIDAGINYPKTSFSEAYLSLYPLTKFYKLLSIDYDTERYMPLYEKDYVTIDNIRDVLKNLETDVTYEDIKDDIDKHCILTWYKDSYIWGSKIIHDWMLNVDPVVFKTINLNKIFSIEQTLF